MAPWRWEEPADLGDPASGTDWERRSLIRPGISLSRPDPLGLDPLEEDSLTPEIDEDFYLVRLKWGWRIGDGNPIPRSGKEAFLPFRYHRSW